MSATDRLWQPEPVITVLYGSQKGTSQEIARNIHAEAAARGMRAQVRGAAESRDACWPCWRQLAALCLLVAQRGADDRPFASVPSHRFPQTSVILRSPACCPLTPTPTLRPLPR